MHEMVNNNASLVIMKNELHLICVIEPLSC